MSAPQWHICVINVGFKVFIATLVSFKALNPDPAHDTNGPFSFSPLSFREPVPTTALVCTSDYNYPLISGQHQQAKIYW